MPRFRHARGCPAEHLAPGERWPNGRLADDSPPEACHAQELARRLHRHTAGYTNAEIAERAGITENALSRLKRGRTWSTPPVIIRLEAALGADLWCGKDHSGETAAGRVDE